MQNRIENGTIEFTANGLSIEFRFFEGEISSVTQSTLILDQSGKMIDYITVQERNIGDEKYFCDKFDQLSKSDMKRNVFTIEF